MASQVRRRLLSAIVVVSAIALLLAPRFTAAGQPDPVTAAWERARAAGSYHFGSDVVQVTTPIATVANVGRTSREERLRLEGETNLPKRVMELRLWTGGGSVMQAESGAAVRVEGDKTMVREGLGAWKEAPGFTGAIAPDGDFMAYLRAIRDHESHPAETRAGVTFTRHTFRIDGPTFAAYVRDQTEAAMRRQGGLPAGAHIDVPEYYAKMTGTGELWINSNGLPLRQILRLQFPERKNETVSADITVDFSRWGTPPGGVLGALGVTRALEALRDDPTPALSLVLWTTFAVLLLRFRRSRTLQRTVPVVVIVSLLLSPLLSGQKTRDFFETQAVQAAEQEQSAQDSDMARTLKVLQGEEQFDPHVAPAVNQGSEVGVQQSEDGSDTAAAPVPMVGPAATIVDNGTDSDNDGLTNFLEVRIGTDPQAADTDGDIITDTLEVRGFSYRGQMWYTDPFAMDSNRDSLSDLEEWFRDSNNDTIPDDTDADGLPDLFDDDDDGDDVPDRMDAAPLMHSRMNGGSTTPFSESNPFSLTLKNLSTTQTTFVDFQLRPQDPKHLWYANNVLDWPSDRQGQMQDGDDKTFANVATAAGRQPTEEESYGDMKLVPMLEVRITGTSTHLPPQAELSAYGVVTNAVTTPFVGTVAYVPLTIVTDDNTGARVAFNARLPYRAASAAINGHQVRLVWVVQALLDQCKESADGVCTLYESTNQSQVVQTYYDAWTLTGLNVREDHGVKTAIIYEDPGSNRTTPAPDRNPRDDGPLWMLADGLDNAFLSGRDCDTRGTDDACVGDGTRDVGIDDIYNRFNWPTNSAFPDTDARRWSIPDTLKVEQGDYPTLDKAVMTTAVTETKRILRDSFNTHWAAADERPVMPLLMYAREERLRATDLSAARTTSGFVTLSGSALTVDLAPAGKSALPITTITGLKWSAYCGEAGATSSGPDAVAWTACDHAAYWEELERRHAADAAWQDEAPEMAQGRLVIAQLYYLSLAQGVSSVVQRGLNLVNPDFNPKADSEQDATNKIAIGGSHGIIMTLLDITVTQRFKNTESVLKNLGRILTELKEGIATKVGAAVDDFRHWFGGNKLRGTLIVTGVVVVIAAVITAVGFLIKYYMSGNKAAVLTGKIILNTIVIGFTLAFAVVKPIIEFVQNVKGLMATVAGTTLAKVQSALHTATVQGSKAALGAKVVGAIGAVIAIGVTWAFFIYSMVSNNVTAFSPQFNRALAEAVAASIYIIITTILAATLVGLIIVGIIALVDAVLTAICELGVDEMRDVPGLDGSCFTFGAAAVKVIAKALYSYDIMVDMERKDIVVTGAPDITLANPLQGYRAGNQLSVSLPVTTTIVHKDPVPENWMHILPYIWLFSEGSLKSSTFGYSTTQSETTIDVDRGSMEDDWFDVKEDHKFAATPMYRGQASSTHGPVTGLPLTTPGLNKSVPFYLNMGYAVPAYECWTVPNPVPVFVPPVIPVCYRRDFDGNTSTKIEALLFDIFPSTLDGFMTLADKGDGGLGLAWDDKFLSIKDADGDDMLGTAHNGLDPNDGTWDADGDGMADRFELERREAGVDFSAILWDTDNDGLTDAQEMEFGTHPARADSDNDGLKDGEEVRHMAYTLDTTTLPTETKRLRLKRDANQHVVWEGGWTVVITGVKELNTTRTVSVNVSSDPTLFDSDGDGVSDQAERELATGEAKYRLDEQGMPYHPTVANNNPLRVYVDVNDTDRVVRPGQALTYSTTIATGSAPFAPNGVLNVAAPSVLGGNPPAKSLTLASGRTTTVQSNLLVAPNALSQTAPISSSVRARLADRTGPEWQWAPVTPEAALGGNASYPFRSAEAAASRPDRQDSYLVTPLTSDTGGERANGDVRTYEVAISGNGTGTLDADADAFGGDRLYKRGTAAPRVACADNGKCMTVWDDYDNCDRVTISAVKVIDGSPDHGTGGIEPNIWISRNNQPDELIYVTEPFDHKKDETRYPGVVRDFCGPATIGVYESDGNYKDERIGSLDIAPGAEEDGYRNFKGADYEVGVYLTTTKRNRHAVNGAIVGANAKAQRSRYVLSNLSYSDRNAHDYSPVVATNGTNFLVAWERAYSGSRNTSSRIFSRLFNNSGDPISPELLVDEQYFENNLQNRTLDLDVASIGDRYRLVWKLRGGTNSGTIRMLDINSAGTAVLTPSTSITTNAASPPRLAYDRLTGRTLVVYRASNGNVKGRLYQGASMNASEMTIAPAGANPRVAYHPGSQGWVVGWTNPTNAVFEFVALKADGTALLPAAGSVQQTTWAGAGAINGGTSLSCPAPSAVPTADYRFEEQPGATTFVDRSGFNRNAAIASGQPAAGAPGSDQAPLSDYAVALDGIDDSLTIPNSPRGDVSLAFWARTSRNAGGATHWFEGQGIVDGYKPTDGGGFGVALGAGKVLFGIGVPGQPGASATISTPESVANGDWHFFVATRERATGALKLYMDGNPTPVSTGVGGTHLLNGSTNLRIGSLLNGTNFFAGDIDYLTIYDTVLSGETARAIYNRTVQSFCLAATPGTTGVPFARLSLDRPDRRGGRLDVIAALSVRVDADAPTSSVTSFTNGAYIQGAPNGAATTKIIGGAANDTGSGITKVEVSVNNGAWQVANGKASWTYALPVTQGSYTVRTRATDGAGNVETPGTGRTVIVDSTPPSGSITAPGTTPVVPVRGPAGLWHVSVTGSVTGPAVTAQNGSQVEVLLQGRTGLGEGAGWQRATLTAKPGGVDWSVSYSLSANLPDPTGSYAVSVRIRDGSGATTTNNAARIIHLDSNGPGAALRQSDATRQVISNTLTLGGTISDTYSLDRMEARYTPITEVVALSGTALLLPLDERAGSAWYTDSSAQNQAGRCATSPCPVAGEAGRMGSALRFNGTALARVPHDQSIDFVAGESFAIGAWIKTSAAGLIMRKANGATTGYALEVGSNGAAALLTNGATVTGGPDLRDNQWHHVVGMVDRSTNQAHLYIDGVLRGSQSFSGSVANSADLNLGGWSNATTARFNGLIDQVTVWGRALGGSEVQALFAAPATPWRPATLSAGGANVVSANWTSAVPAGLEGQYQIDLRGFDTLGNARMSPNVWRGVIDTLAPRVAMVARSTGAQYTDSAGTLRYEFGYACVAEDRHLDESAFSCSNNTTIEGSRTFTEDPALRALFPDMVMRTGLSAAYFTWESTQTPAATTRACDTFGRCATSGSQSSPVTGQARVSGTNQFTARAQRLASSQLQASATTAVAGLPQSVVISPTNQSVVAATGTFPVRVAAESSQPLKEIKLTLDGSPVATIALAKSEAVTRTERVMTLTGVAQGQHVLEAVATDWANNTQATPFRATFQVDTTPPAVTLDTTMLETDDTLQQGSGMMRFAGTASDGLGLATVQLRIGDGAFTDVAFSPDGNWRTIQWLGHAPEGQSFLVTVKAIDRSGRITEVSRTIAVNIQPIRPDPSDDPPDTTITSRPPTMSASDAASFGFAGTDAKTPAASLRFECRVDSGVFTACASPRDYTGLSDGRHTFQVRAFDEIGNADPTPAAYTWTVDTTPPETTLVTAASGTPPNPSNSDLARFTFSASDGAGTGVARIECQLDNSAWGACVSPRNYSDLRDGMHTFRVRAVDVVGNVDPTPASYSWTINTTLYFAAEQGMKVRGVQAAHEDILQIDGADVVSVFFDGSDVGINNMKIDAFARLADGSLLFSFDKDKSNPKGKTNSGIAADDSDIVRFTPRSLGENTAGTWSMYFDASDVGLTTDDEDVDGVTVLPDGKILVSTTGDAASVPGVAGAVDNSDILQFIPSRLGDTTAGTWSTFFDGSDVGLTTADENIDGFTMDVDGRLYFSTTGRLEVPGVTADNEDVVIFSPTALGANTAGAYRQALFLDFSALGYGGDIKGINLRR